MRLVVDLFDLVRIQLRRREPSEDVYIYRALARCSVDALDLARHVGERSVYDAYRVADGEVGFDGDFSSCMRRISSSVSGVGLPCGPTKPVYAARARYKVPTCRAYISF